MKALFLVIVLFVAATVSYSEDKAPAKDHPKEAVKKGEVTYEGGDGSSFEKAVIIKGANGETVGVGAEYKWISKNFPGWKRVKQSLKFKDNKKYDILEIQDKEGKTKEIYFDITDFFGKF